jgi:predicted metalloendopeptidase
MRRQGGLTDPEEWLVTPQTVNAYYAPASNEIVLPAAMLQPPLFDPSADDAVNYGAIGGVLGHEMAHVFDERGRAYDATGALRDWWTPQDVNGFRARVATLVAQFDAYEPLPGVHVNGTLTRSENIGDLAGLEIAYRAYQLSLGGRPSVTLDGLTGEQRFFLSWARTWRGKERDEYLRQILFSREHAPWPYRANGPVSHLQAFYDAFGVKQGDRLYRAPDQRVRIW